MCRHLTYNIYGNYDVDDDDDDNVKLRVFRGFFWLKNVVALAIYNMMYTTYISILLLTKLNIICQVDRLILYTYMRTFTFFFRGERKYVDFSDRMWEKIIPYIDLLMVFFFLFSFFYVNSFKFGADYTSIYSRYDLFDFQKNMRTRHSTYAGEW